MEIQEFPEETVIRFSHRKEVLLERDVAAVRDQILELLSTTTCRRLVLNFANIKILTSSALAMLLAINKHMRSQGGQLVLCKLNSQMLNTLEVAQLTQLFEIPSDEGSSLPAEVNYPDHNEK